MIYGKHTKLVDEVINFSCSMNECKKSNIPEDISVINEFNRIKYLAIEEGFGEEEYTWSDIRQLEMGDIKGEIYKLKDDERLKGLDRLLDIIADGLREHISDLYSDFFENVVVDLRNCAINRAVNGQINNFYEKVFEIYKAGGFPCGWSGNYPEGNIIAYFPI